MRVALLKGETSNLVYKLLIEQTESTYNVTILGETKSYICQIEPRDITNFAKLYEITQEQYEQKLQQLLHAGITDSAYIHLKQGKFELYKNKFIKLFEKVVVEVDHVASLNKCVEHLCKENETQSNAHKQLLSHKNELQDELSKLKVKFEQYIDEANEREEQLYAKFVQLLNEKKMHIQRLRYHIDDEKFANISTDASRKRRAEISASEGSDDECNYDTDEENRSKPSTSKIRNTVKEKITPKQEDNFGLDCSLLDSDSDNDQLFITALPLHNERSCDYSVIDKSMEKEMKVESVDEKGSQKEENNSGDETSDGNTQVISYSTQDLLNNI